MNKLYHLSQVKIIVNVAIGKFCMFVSDIFHLYPNVLCYHIKACYSCLCSPKYVAFYLAAGLVRVERSDVVPVLAGSRHLSLTCIARKVTPESSSQPTAQWLSHGLVGPGDTNVVTSKTANSTTAVANLSFLNLHTSHARLYTCQGGIFVMSVKNTVDSSALIRVRCK